MVSEINLLFSSVLNLSTIMPLHYKRDFSVSALLFVALYRYELEVNAVLQSLEFSNLKNYCHQ